MAESMEAVQDSTNDLSTPAPIPVSAAAASTTRTGATDAMLRDPTFKLGWQEKYTQAKVFKGIGNEKYKDKSFRGAMGKYHRSLLYIKGIEDAQNAGPLSAIMPSLAGDSTPIVPEHIRREIALLKMDVYNNLAGKRFRINTPVI